jgi:hypothetical protein
VQAARSTHARGEAHEIGVGLLGARRGGHAVRRHGRAGEWDTGCALAVPLAAIPSAERRPDGRTRTRWRRRSSDGWVRAGPRPALAPGAPPRFLVTRATGWSSRRSETRSASRCSSSC